MPVFKKHYTREEARQLLPSVKNWLDELARVRALMHLCDEEVARQLAGGNDAGGETVNKLVTCAAALKQILLRFELREIQIKDPDRGLIDFPAFIGGREVFLCWERGEEDIEFWHDLASGYAGREKI